MNIRPMTRKIAVTGIISAIIIALQQLNIGYLPIGPTKATILHIPVIIATLLEGPVIGLITALIFGLSSILEAVIRPTTPLAFAFLNPLVAVLPRLLIPITTYLAYKLVKTIRTRNQRANIAIDLTGVGVAAAIGTLTNTVGVLYLLYVIYAQPVFEIFKAGGLVKSISELAPFFIYSIGFANGLPEMLVAVIITIPIVAAVKRAKLSKIGFN